MLAHRGPRLSRVAVVACAALLGFSLVGCGSLHALGLGSSASPTSTPRAQRATPAPIAFPRPHPTICPATIAPEFTCVMEQRITEVERYLATQPGHIGIVLHDRVAGATWRNAEASTVFPAASTIKLAMVLDVMLRDRAGTIQLGDNDWALIDAILSESSDTAADQLWGQFEGFSFLARIRAFGMTSGYFSSSSAYWGFMYCSAEDLDNLMNYILNDSPAAVRSYLTSRMQRVAPIQQWGVWGAGPANHPGNKDGWEDDSGVWVVNTVGFAGSQARFSLAIMDDEQGAADFHQGTNTLDQISSLLFRGRYGPEPTVEATP